MVWAIVPYWHIISAVSTSNTWGLGTKWEKKEGKLLVMCLMMVRRHVASLRFLDDWNVWYIPHAKSYRLQLTKTHSRLNSPDSAGLHGCGYSHGFVDVVGEYSSNQAIIWVVGSFYHFFDSFELHDLLDWSKNLRQSITVLKEIAH